MANIPTQERPASPQNRAQQMPQRPAATYNRPVQYPQKNMPSRVPQVQRINPAVNNMRQNGYQRQSVPPRAAAEQLRPIKDPKSSAVDKKTNIKPKKKRDYSKLKDFLLAFIVSLVLFGIAAIIVCNALISLFT